MIVNGVRMDHVRRCHCGRKPEIMTGYKGFDDGTGPFVISCMHGLGGIMEQYEKVRRGEQDGERYVFCRSWSKTRVVANWRALIAQSLSRNLDAVVWSETQPRDPSSYEKEIHDVQQ